MTTSLGQDWRVDLSDSRRRSDQEDGELREVESK